MTTRQAIAIEKVVENGGNVSRAMIDAGYSPQTAKSPHKLSRSKAFQEAMIKAGINDDSLSTVLAEGLKATKAVVMGTKSDESFVDIQPDYAIRHKYLETAIKVNGVVNEDTSGDTYNTFIQQNNINPNTQDAQDMVDNTLEYLMEQTKRQQ